ncbi:hypothetical protein DFS33DRAFT_1357774 [Desarmillaria ectypa]|nr:hypothetical protein DFS33DRAFT_1357774 [Desarmillaria ectypa]
MSETGSTSAPDNTMGALLICTVISACFQGITVLCSWEYFVDHTKDRAVTKALVSVVCFIDTLHQVFITHALYMYLVKGFSDPAIMMRLLWSFLSQIVLTALQGLLCQGFFTWRVWVVSQKNKILSAIIAALVVGNFVVTLYLFGRSVHFKSLAELLQLNDISKLLVIGYSANLLITASLLFMHFRNTTVPGEQTNRVIDKFALCVLNSGLLTSLAGAFCFIIEAVWPQTLLSAAMYTILCRMYSISVLAVLSSKKQLGSSGSNTQRLSSEIMSNRSRMPRPQVTRPGELAIRVECDTQMQYDNMESPQSHKAGETFELTPFPIIK